MARNKGSPGNGDYLPRFLWQLRRLARRHLRPTAARRTCEPAPLPSARGKTILIVQLDRWTYGPLAQQLERSGYATQVVGGETAALTALAQEPPALLIVAGRADLEFYCSLRRVTAVPILALDPQADDEQMLSAFAAGVDQFQVGTISCDEAVARILALLRRAT